MRAPGIKSHKRVAAPVSVLVGAVFYIVSVIAADRIVVWSTYPRTVFQGFLYRILQFLPDSAALYSFSVFLFMGLVATVCLYFISEPNRDGVRVGMKCFGSILGMAFLFILLGNSIFGGRLPDFYWNYSGDAFSRVFYTSPLLAVFLIVVGNGGLKRHYVKFICPTCRTEVRAKKNTNMVCGECGDVFYLGRSSRKTHYETRKTKQTIKKDV